jgi:hypothetical protein
MSICRLGFSRAAADVAVTRDFVATWRAITEPTALSVFGARLLGPKATRRVRFDTRSKPLELSPSRA